MGQKVNSIGLRLRNKRKWDSKWFTEKGYSDLFYRDYVSTKYSFQSGSGLFPIIVFIQKFPPGILGVF